MVNNGTENCDVVILNAEKGEIILNDFWTDSADPPVQFFFNDTLIFEFTKYDVQNYNNYTLNVGVQYFSLPPLKSFTVLFSRRDT